MRRGGVPLRKNRCHQVRFQLKVSVIDFHMFMMSLFWTRQHVLKRLDFDLVVAAVRNLHSVLVRIHEVTKRLFGAGGVNVLRTGGFFNGFCQHFLLTNFAVGKHIQCRFKSIEEARKRVSLVSASKWPSKTVFCSYFEF